jgi:hypothetical protein
MIRCKKLWMICFLSLFFIQTKSFAYTEERVSFLGEAFAAYDNFRGISEGAWNGNTGAVVGTNLGVVFNDAFGLQAGGSVGAYDWYGRGTADGGSYGAIQQQYLLTAGMFYQTPCLSGWQVGAAVDWMFNKNMGAFGLNPNFGQLRLQAGYLFCGNQEFGLLLTTDIDTGVKNAGLTPVSYRAIGQLSLFWRYFFRNCSEAVVWAGLPYKESLMLSGKRAGQYILGTSIRVPLTWRLCLEVHGMYMGPEGNAFSRRFANYSANAYIGLNYAFGSGSNERCEPWHLRPYLPLANNSNFLVDASLND